MRHSETVVDLQRKNLRDLFEGIRMADLWTSWAWLEIKQKYRRSVIGNFWITINLGVLIGGMGVVFGILFGKPIDTYLPYVGTGMVAWGLGIALINDGAHTFIDNSNNILHYNLPTSVYVFRSLFRGFLVFAHNFVIVVLVILLFPVDVNLNTLLFIPGIVIIFLNGFWVTVVLGFISLRFRDLPMLVANVIQVSFFITPIFWEVETLGDKRFIGDLNPLYHFVQVIRAPLLGQVPTDLNYAVTGVITTIGVAAAILLFVRIRHRIVYWF